MDSLFQNGIMCQKRTGKHKQFTVYMKHESYPNGIIVKGPYSPDKLVKLKQRYQELLTVDAMFIIYPIGYIKMDDKDFIVYPNVGIEPFDQCETEMNEESFTSYKYRVLKRTSLRKISDILRDNPETSWITKWATHMVKVFIKLFLMGCGDMGFYNSLADEKTKQIYIIDFDEDRGVEMRSDEFFFFTRYPAKEVATTFSKYVCWSYIRWYINDMKSKIIDDNPDLDKVKLLCDTFKNNIGKMENHGPMGGSITYSGYKIDIMKSGLQKYIRRGDVMKALECGFELYRMIEVDLRPINSNMYNRLAVISAEDIGPSDINIVLRVLVNVIEDNNNRSYSVLASMIQGLCTSKKTRVLSHLNRTYNPAGEAARNKYNIKIVSNKTITWQSKKEDPPGLDELGSEFNNALSESRLDAFYWYYQLRNKLMEDDKYLKGSRRFNRKGADMIIWEILEKHTDKVVFPILLKAYNTFTEKNVFLSLCIFVSVKKLTGIVFNLDVNVKSWDKHYLIPDLLLGRYTLIIDPWVIDKHTSDGRQQGKNRDDFVKEGSLVIPEDETYMTEEYRVYKEIYMM